VANAIKNRSKKLEGHGDPTISLSKDRQPNSNDNTSETSPLVQI